MARTLSVPVVLFGLVALAGTTVTTQQPLSPGYLDPKPILDRARKAIGTDNLKCVTISGTAYDGALGQQKETAKNVDWPRIDSLANYTRTMNWDNGTMKEEFDRKPGLAPAMWKYGIGWIGGTPLQKNTHQTFMLNGRYGWDMDGTGSQPIPVPPDIAEIWPVELLRHRRSLFISPLTSADVPKRLTRRMRSNSARGISTKS